MLQLQSIAKDIVNRHGAGKIAEVTSAKPELVAAWGEGTKQPSLAQLSLMLDYDPDSIHKVQPLYTSGLPEGQRLAICMNTNRAVDWRTMQSITKLYESAKMQLLIQPTNFLIRGRNQLAWRFLQTECEWSLWVDDDVVLPCGDAEWFRKATQTPNFPEAYAGLNTIGRLLSSGKKLIGGCYVSRFPNGSAQFHEAAGNVNVAREIQLQGPRNAVVLTKWVAAGCLLVHRDVFIDMAKQGIAKRLSESSENVLRYRYGFFDPVAEGLGEDTSFCFRAADAGHKTFVDLAVMPGHVGPHVFTTYNTRP